MDPRIVVNTQELEKVIPALHEAVSTSEPIDGATPVEQARFLAILRGAMDDLRAAQKRPDVLASPSNPAGALLQSIIASNPTDLIEKQDKNVLEATFDEGDWIGWATTLWHMLKDAKNRFAWQTALPDPESVDQFKDGSSIAVFGDWGTGMYGAPVISQTIRANDVWKFVLHLGDVYYSGTADEYKSRFNDVWPTRPGNLNRALNGNHEMYSGGRPYFDTIQKDPFRQKASYFAYQNENWIVVGLDTAYGDKPLDDQNITTGQVDWLTRIVANAGDRKVVLFSHHQPFSLLSAQGPKLQSRLGPLLSTGKIFAWYWGHEHECVIYDRHPAWNLYGRCIGHAGMPEFRPIHLGTGVKDRQLRQFKGIAADTDKNLVAVPDSLILDGWNPLIKGEESQFTPHGFAVLEFHGKTLTEHYLDPDGTEFHTIDLR